MEAVVFTSKKIRPEVASRASYDVLVLKKCQLKVGILLLLYS